MSKTILIAALVICVVAVAAILVPALCQPGGGPPGQGGGGNFDMGGPPPPPMMGAAAVAVGDGVVYVASDGKLTAFEAKTLKKLTEATYSTAGGAPQGPPPGGNPGN